LFLNLLNNSSVDIGTGFRLDSQSSVPGRSKRFFSTMSGPAVGPIQSQAGALSLGVKQPGCEADTSIWCQGQEWQRYTTYIFMTWCLIKHRDNFTFFTIYQQLMPIDKVAKSCTSPGVYFDLDVRTE
jgi:hypothetical protein